MFFWPFKIVFDLARSFKFLQKGPQSCQKTHFPARRPKKNFSTICFEKLHMQYIQIIPALSKYTLALIQASKSDYPSFSLVLIEGGNRFVIEQWPQRVPQPARGARRAIRRRSAGSWPTLQGRKDDAEFQMLCIIHDPALCCVLKKRDIRPPACTAQPLDINSFSFFRAQGLLAKWG